MVFTGPGVLSIYPDSFQFMFVTALQALLITPVNVFINENITLTFRTFFEIPHNRTSLFANALRYDYQQLR
jgi:hypothetical protein